MPQFIQRTAIALLLVGCSPDPSTGSNDAGDTTPDVGAEMSVDMPVGGPLIDHEAWTAVAAADDPFVDRPAMVECERGVGWDVEPLDVETTIGVDTIDCDYLGLTQPILRAVTAGETLAVQLWHFQLEGDGPGHAAIAVDGAIVWERTIEIPGESELIAEQFDVPDGAPEGAPIVFHLHNHGLNSWNLIAIREPDE